MSKIFIFYLTRLNFLMGEKRIIKNGRHVNHIGSVGNVKFHFAYVTLQRKYRKKLIRKIANYIL